MKHENMIGKKMKEFTFFNLIGEGANALVYEAFNQTTNQTVAIKVIPQILIKERPKLMELVKAEITILKQCKNQNVVRFVTNFKTDKSILIVMEYCNQGDLEQYLVDKKRLTEDQATTFLKQIINGFKGLHQVNAMHRDFKLANVLMHNEICKIADLGFAKQMEKKTLTKTLLGTGLTMAPQILKEKPYGREADIWSLGVVYYQLLYGKYPFEGVTDQEILKKIENTCPNYSQVNISKYAKDFIHKCLTVDPEKRISWKEVYEHQLILKNQEKIVYTVRSRIDVKENKNFYEKNEDKGSQNLMYLDKKQKFSKAQLGEDFQETDVRTSDKINNIMKDSQDKKKINSSIEKYIKGYLNIRNKIMFIFKFITPFVLNLFSINANHLITMFIISKKAYLQMKEFYNNLMKKNNFLDLKPFFYDFISSQPYRNLIETAQTDMQIIISQLQSYRIDIAVCSQEVKAEFQIDHIHSNHWDLLVKEIIDAYTFQLGEALNQVQAPDKENLIKVIEAFHYYQEKAEKIQIQEFDKMMECIDYKKAEIKIKKDMNTKLNNI